MKRFIWLVSLVILGACSFNRQDQPYHYVDPFIGTGGHGHTYPGATLPFGMVQLSPDTRKDNWDACSGYHYSDSTIMGFSHTHLSGTGVGDYGDIRVMPIVGGLKIRPGDEDLPGSGYRSRFSHSREQANPGYYQVFLEDYQVVAELTVSRRCGFHQYTFPAADEAYIVFDLKESVVTEQNPDLYIKIVNDHEISGYRRSSGWAADQVVYFYAAFSRPFDGAGIAADGKIIESSGEAKGADIQTYVKYVTGKNEVIKVKVGISGVSVEGAHKNLTEELPGWDFDEQRKLAGDAWNEELRKVEISGGSHDDRVKFYTALYHCYLAPNLFSDADGQYRGNDGKVYQTEDFDVYTVFSLWDTYRANHPLMTLLQPQRTVDFIRTFLDIYDKRGLLPVWELAGNETYCMIGYHAVPVIVDAYIKGIDKFDLEKAYYAIRNSAEQDHFGLEFYREFGYIPAEMEGEAISKTLEYAYDDWCIALMAKKMGKKEDYSHFLQRAQYYKNLYDPETKFLRGKRNGMFAEPFVSGLIELMGGEEQFESKLDEMFAANPELSGRQQADITGLIGQYAHGNEPSHHMAYLYNYVGRPDKTQRLVRQIMEELYGTEADGLCGNEDCGQMSAWFVMSALGFYPVTPGIGYYALGSPLFEEIRIQLDNGKDFIIRSKNNNSSNLFIQSAELNGEPYGKSFISHEDIINGGILVLNMGSITDNGWGRNDEDLPVSEISDDKITPVPYFKAGSGSFQEKLSVKLKHVFPDAQIFYQSDCKNVNHDFKTYTDSIETTESVSFKAYAVSDSGIPSKISCASFYKIHHDWTIKIKHEYSNQYTAGGNMALIDGQRGGANFRTGS
ncbi:MAG: GH92 family glycosyl hydrolase, partial [Bacteroidales bacterium]|nr:GH92 family glycosyl hydrolase [Bacteroidales bacterium]